MEKKLVKKAIELFNMEAAMNAVIKAPGFLFQIRLAKNLKALKDELDIIREKSKQCEEFEKAQEKANELKKSFAALDKKGNPKIITENLNGRTVQRYDVPEDKMEELEKAHQEFWDEEENKLAREKQDQIYKEYDEFIKNEDIEITLFTIPASAAPEVYFNDENHKEALQYFANTCFELIED